MMRIHDVNSIIHDVEEHGENQKEIQALLYSVLEDIENLIIDFSSTMDQTRKANWTSQLSIAENTYKDYSRNIKAKIFEVKQRNPAASNGQARDDIEREKNDILRRQAEAQEKANQAREEEKSEKLNESTRVADEKKRLSIANAKVKFSNLNEDITELAEQVNKVTKWEDDEDLEIGRAMR